jgi:hypothetical protein
MSRRRNAASWQQRGCSATTRLALEAVVDRDPICGRGLLVVRRFLCSQPKEPRGIPTRACDRLRDDLQAVIGFPLPAEPPQDDQHVMNDALMLADQDGADPVAPRGFASICLRALHSGNIAAWRRQAPNFIDL